MMGDNKQKYCPACASKNIILKITYQEWVQYHQKSQKNFVSIMLQEEDLQFNAIQCAEVIEHCAHPHQFIQDINALLAPKGIFILTTPEVQITKTKKELLDWRELRPPEHITLFTKNGINQLLKQYFKKIIFIPKIKKGIQIIAFKE